MIIHFSTLSVSEMDECDKIGKSCPSNLKCLKKNGSFACDCENTGFIVKGSGERRTCQGTKSLLERLKVTFMANGKREIEVENFSQQKITG